MLKEFLKKIIPIKYHTLIRLKLLNLISLLYYGNSYYCPVCERGFRKFLPYGHIKRENAQCPKCGSLERHRLLWLFLQTKTNLFTEELKVLHISPNLGLQRRFKKMSNLNYLSADLFHAEAMIKMDIMDIPYGNEIFDVILLNQVLECVKDDDLALKEIFRVLKGGGRLFFSHLLLAIKLLITLMLAKMKDINC